MTSESIPTGFSFSIEISRLLRWLLHKLYGHQNPAVNLNESQLAEYRLVFLVNFRRNHHGSVTPPVCSGKPPCHPLPRFPRAYMFGRISALQHRCQRCLLSVIGSIGPRGHPLVRCDFHLQRDWHRSQVWGMTIKCHFPNTPYIYKYYNTLSPTSQPPVISFRPTWQAFCSCLGLAFNRETLLNRDVPTDSWFFKVKPQSKPNPPKAKRPNPSASERLC